MSIKTIDKQIKGSAGIAKKINKGAEKMVFDILQSTQYSMPIQSTVRELVTNACDSQREKEVALEILGGKKEIKDYYIERHGPQYEDSNFDIGYYNVASLAHAKNHIQLTYSKKDGVGYCDIFEVTDYGVGIGGRRLEGILELGYSTKRNTSENFGAFGLGAKAALSTGVDFYTIETIHNGKRFKCNCYNYKTDFIISKFNVKTGKQNPFITFTDGTKVYYEETDRKNQTTVSFGVKKHNRNKFEEAVEDQLTYLDNVRFFIRNYEKDNEHYYEKDKNYSVREVNFKADILYNSDNLIVSDNYHWSKPHIVVVKDPKATTGINYGFVDFRELEMEQLYGNIAFKCPIRQVITNEDGTEVVLQEGVDVTPSREKVIWNDATKVYVQSVMDKAAKEATDLVQEELKEDDFLKWITKCKAIVNGDHSNPILSKLSRIVDKQMLKPKYSKDQSIRYSNPKTLFKGIQLTSLYITHEKGKQTIAREKLDNWDRFDAKNLYEKGEQFSKYKDLYLIEELNVINKDWDYKNEVTVFNPKDLNSIFDDRIKGTQKGDTQQLLIKEKANTLVYRTKIINFIKESELYKQYDEIEVPEDWVKDKKIEEKEQEEISKFDNLTPSERREIEKRMVAYTLRYEDRKWTDDTPYIFDKIEPKVKDMMQTNTRTYYATGKDEGKLYLAGIILHKMAPTHKCVYPNSNYPIYDDVSKAPVFFFDCPPVRFLSNWGENKGQYYDWAITNTKDWDIPQLIKISENKVKFLEKNENCRPISEFFLQVNDNNGYTMDQSLIKWFTSQQMTNIKDYNFMAGLAFIHPELAKDWKELNTLVSDCDWEYRHKKLIESKEILQFVSKVAEFQRFCREVSDDDNKEELIQDKSQELFMLSDIGECSAEMDELLDKYKNLVEFADDVKPLLSNIRALQDQDATIELEKELRVYLKAKNRETWK